VFIGESRQVLEHYQVEMTADALKNEARVKVSMHRIVTDKCFLNFDATVF
jgi:hypothetical protein